VKKVLIIVVAYNGENYLERLFNSIDRFEPDADVIVIDNNSKDSSVKIIEKHGKIKLIQLDENKGFGAANNIGLKYAIDNEYHYVFLFNQDTYLTESIFKELIKISILENNCCVISPLQMNGTNTELELSFEKFLFESGYISKNILKPNEKLFKLNFIQAAAWFIPIEIIKSIGGFDPLFFHYGEDNNYCQRLQFFNIPLYVAFSISICHDSNPFNEYFPRNYGSYHINRLKSNYLIKYSNINSNIELKSNNAIIWEFMKKGFRFLIKFQFRSLNGLLKYSIFQMQFKEKILISCEINKIRGINYIN
jgi:GT2 family glycosyltransferase